MQILHGIKLRLNSTLVGMKRNASSMVACNIYVSPSEKKQTKQSLVHILKAAQLKCNQLRESKDSNNYDHDRRNIVLVHAYTDDAYGRSSFHLAGTPESVIDVASYVARLSLEAFSPSDCGEGSEEDINESRHPTVGIVDHIAVMPLSSEDTSDAHGKAAREIGKVLTTCGVHVIFYGSADIQNTPLATIRKEKTTFFKSGSLGGTTKGKGICTVGSPSSFVENFNIRLNKMVSKQDAMLLTKKVRHRDGGVYGVEALTLPYSGGRYEVACNLLYPGKGDVNDIISKIDEWLQSLKDDHKIKPIRSEYVEVSYRVGTTMKQCNDVLNQDESFLKQHDKNVLEHFISYFEKTNEYKI